MVDFELLRRREQRRQILCVWVTVFTVVVAGASVVFHAQSVIASYLSHVFAAVR